MNHAEPIIAALKVQYWYNTDMQNALAIRFVLAEIEQLSNSEGQIVGEIERPSK